ncbi:hypothetical protein RIR_jg9504.t1 [Rhizophagus irregularis DAOM 181602=DAOM 197198]|nr:hypothetical protein RIR_jg9504.t1 [Rhizophagus irregularis DAOM 181602=DAOM 197198]
MLKCRNSFDMSKLSKPKNITFHVITQHPMIVERCTIAYWNRLITISRMVVRSSFYFAKVLRPSLPLLLIKHHQTSILSSPRESTYFHGGLLTGSINHLVPFHTTILVTTQTGSSRHLSRIISYSGYQPPGITNQDPKSRESNSITMLPVLCTNTLSN